MNRKLFFLVGLATLLLAAPVTAKGGEPPIPNPPSSNNYVLDTLNWLSESQEQEINLIVRRLNAEGTAQIYVVTLDDCGSDKTQYRRAIFDAWKIGSQKRAGGLLILACWYGGDKSRRSLEVKTDEKMQGIIPDTLTATTTENKFVPAFKEKQPGMGLVNMVIVFEKVIRGKKPAVAPPSATYQMSYEAIILTMLLVPIIVFAIVLSTIWKDNDRRNGRYIDRDFGSNRDGGGEGGGSSTRF